MDGEKICLKIFDHAGLKISKGGRITFHEVIGEEEKEEEEGRYVIARVTTRASKVSSCTKKLVLELD